MSLWLPCGLHGVAVPNTVTVTVTVYSFLRQLRQAADCVLENACAALSYPQPGQVPAQQGLTVRDQLLRGKGTLQAYSIVQGGCYPQPTCT